MKRSPFALQATAIGLVFAVACVAGSLFSSVPAGAQITVHVDIGNAPPPPRFVFRSRPHETYIASQRVYVVDDPRVGDNDCFRYGGDYWLFRDGYWYRARSWRSPFVVVQPRYVPTAFYQVPPAHWKHAPADLRVSRDAVTTGRRGR